jgi:hypothetical protein
MRDFENSPSREAVARDPQESPVTRASIELDKTYGLLHESITQLIGSLEPVLTPVPTADPNSAIRVTSDGDDARSQQVQFLQVQTNRARNLIDMINMTLERLEL